MQQSDVTHDNNANANEQYLPRDQASTPFTLRQLTLVHGHCAGVDTSSEARNDSANDEMGNRVGRSLESRANDDEAHGEPNHVTPTQQITDSEIDHATNERSQAVTGDDDTGDDIAWIAELVAKVRILQQTREHTLVVSVPAVLANFETAEKRKIAVTYPKKRKADRQAA